MFCLFFFSSKRNLVPNAMCKIVDNLMECQRFNEEIRLIEEEMLRFLKFYTHKKFPELQRNANHSKIFYKVVLVSNFRQKV